MNQSEKETIKRRYYRGGMMAVIDFMARDRVLRAELEGAARRLTERANQPWDAEDRAWRAFARQFVIVRRGGRGRHRRDYKQLVQEAKLLGPKAAAQLDDKYGWKPGTAKRYLNRAKKRTK